MSVFVKSSSSLVRSSWNFTLNGYKSDRKTNFGKVFGRYTSWAHFLLALQDPSNLMSSNWFYSKLKVSLEILKGLRWQGIS